ncbi:MAG: hypothetical protein E7417_06645, partial [Ruminococcaceae bacterium]|nr:hypothetical protein [Oscillospiraceae bacterium]
MIYPFYVIVKLKKSGFHPTRKRVGFTPQIYNDFTKNLLVNYSYGKNNLVLSPFSILVLLCMAADSTDSETRKEVINVINLRRKTHA